MRLPNLPRWHAFVLVLPLTFCTSPLSAGDEAWSEKWTEDKPGANASELTQWDISTLGRGNPGEAVIVSSDGNASLQIAPSEPKLLGVVTKEVFPVANGIAIDVAFEISEASAPEGQTVIFLESARTRNDRLQVNVRRDAVQLGLMRDGNFAVLLSKKIILEGGMNRLRLEVAVNDGGDQSIKVWINDTEIPTVDLPASAPAGQNAAIAFDGSARVALLSQDGCKVDFGPVSIRPL